MACRWKKSTGRRSRACAEQGRHLAEATSLADQDLGIHEFVRVFKTLIKVGMQYHVRQGGDSWVIAVNPRHRGFYQKVLGFVPLGPRGPIRRSGPPGRSLCVRRQPPENPCTGDESRGVRAPLPDSVLRTPQWSPPRVHYFGKRSTQADGRTIDALLSHVERFGSPPRWRDDEIGMDDPRWGIPPEDSRNSEGIQGMWLLAIKGMLTDRGKLLTSLLDVVLSRRPDRLSGRVCSVPQDGKTRLAK